MQDSILKEFLIGLRLLMINALWQTLFLLIGSACCFGLYWLAMSHPLTFMGVLILPIFLGTLVYVCVHKGRAHLNHRSFEAEINLARARREYASESREDCIEHPYF